MLLSKEEVYEKIASSPSLPAIPEQGDDILQMLQSPDTFDLESLADLLEREPTISDFFLRQVNKLTLAEHLSVKEAVLFLGANSSRNILIYFFLSLFHPQGRKKHSPDRKFDVRHYWLHDLCTSLAADSIAQLVGYKENFRLFSYGLLHDLGMLVLDACLAEEIDEICTHALAGMHPLVAEKKVLGGLTHADIGGWVCRRWNFSDDIISIVRYHHTPYLAPVLTDELKILYVANTIGMTYYAELLQLDAVVAVADKRILKTLGLDQADVKRLGEDLPEKVQSFRERFLEI